MMSREIKFRAWDKNENRYFIDGKDGYLANLLCCDDWDMDDPNGYVWEQFTGMKDINGKDIYECDVVHVVTEDGYVRTGKVIFEKGCYWVDNGMDKYPVNRIGFEQDTLEVLGNVHVNPEIIDFYDMKQL